MNIKWPTVNMDAVKRLRDGVYDQVKTAGTWAKEKVTIGNATTRGSETGLNVEQQQDNGKIILGSGAAEGPIYPFYSEGAEEDIFSVGDRVYTTTVVGSIPTGTEVVVTEILNNDPTRTSITVRKSNDDTPVLCRRENLQLPVTCLQLSKEHHVSVYKTDSEKDDTPTSMLFRGDKVFVVRVNRSRTRFQIDTGGWVPVAATWVPLYLPGSPVKCISKVYFDNNRKVSSGCLGNVTANYKRGDPSVEVSIDGVVWDASPAHISPVIPQSIITLFECDGYNFSSDSDDDSCCSPEPKERTLCRSEVDSVDDLSDNSEEDVGPADDVIDTGSVKVIVPPG
eukprot:TRINITY_DN17751_c4_g1_i1.p1 TRINITY_DN17751_c4_g1~~TRINITY_DN17751_c4_g1_i1.p1  ORF type:complete len:338 (+),score=53.01 TRINITY_DN17751_c4_g1_i1:269-1282(+)